jgi:hypothetical protein
MDFRGQPVPLPARLRVPAQPRLRAWLMIAVTLVVALMWAGCVVEPDPIASIPEGSVAIGIADGYEGIWYFNQPSNDEYVYKYSGGFATYPQQQSPIAIYSPRANKTFFCYGGTVPGRQELLHMVSYFDHATGLVPKPTILLNKQTEDAHDNPVMSIDEGGHIWIFSNAHGTSRPSYIHRSRKPFDIRDFELVHTTNFSYGHPWWHPGKGFLFLKTIYEDNNTGNYQAKGRSLYFTTSMDGSNWSEPRLLARAELGHYQITARRGDVTATAFNVHPHPVGLNNRTNLYFLQTRDMGETWQNAAGQTVGIPVTSMASPALVYDYWAEKRLVYLKEVAFDNDGRPVILYLTTKGFESGPKNDPRMWHTARWTGNRWEIHDLTTSDHNYDFGALWIDTDGTWRVIAPTEPGAAPYTTGGDLVLWTSVNKGQSWRRVQQLTKDPVRNHGYVRKPIGARLDFYALWADGETLQPSGSHLYFTDREGTAVWRLPTTIDGDFARPEQMPVPD